MGVNFSVVVTVGGVASSPFWPTPVLSYGIPAVTALTVVPGVDDAGAGVGSTRGGSRVLVSGTNFGSANMHAVISATYT